MSVATCARKSTFFSQLLSRHFSCTLNVGTELLVSHNKQSMTFTLESTEATGRNIHFLTNIVQNV